MTLCKCTQPPFYYLDYETVDLGYSSDFATVTIETCKECKKKWLNYLLEDEHYTKSGRWWRMPIEKEVLQELTALNAKDFIESTEWCFVGGSYYDGKIYTKISPIKVT